MSSVVVIWVWLCAYLNCAGWVLSTLHELNMRGYAVVFALGLGALIFWRQKNPAQIFPAIYPPKLRWRFRRMFPLAFLLLAVLACIGGALYAPANYDALAYRTPRVLHWLAAGQWEWIHTDFHRLNTRTAGFEWVTAPLFLFTGTDRLEFLLNLISFVLLPGRVFSVLVLLGARPRAAWHWMWLFPAGYGYVMQAGSAVNDLFATVFALAAIEFALRAQREQKDFLLWTVGLAAALMTSAKAFNLLLLLPWFIAAFPALKTLLRRPLASLAVILFALSASMIPTSLLNAKYCGDWTGNGLEQTPNGGGQEVFRFIGNVGTITASNFQPPVFPLVSQWDRFVSNAIPAGLAARMQASMEGGLARFQLAELLGEESSGLGCGLSILLTVVLVKKIAARCRKKNQDEKANVSRRPIITRRRLIVWGTWLGLLVLITRAGYVGPARYLLPFYLLLLVPVLTGDLPSQLTRRRWWKIAALFVFISVLPCLVLAPQRPLVPAVTLLRAAGAEHSQSAMMHRVWLVYSVYGRRPDSFAPVIQNLPPDAALLGFMGFDEPEAALWKPFGSRRIKHLSANDSAEAIRARGIKYALVNAGYLAHNRQVTFDSWQQQTRAEQLQVFSLKLRAGKPPGDWRLVSFPGN